MNYTPSSSQEGWKEWFSCWTITITINNNLSQGPHNLFQNIILQEQAPSKCLRFNCCPVSPMLFINLELLFQDIWCNRLHFNFKKCVLSLIQSSWTQSVILTCTFPGQWYVMIYKMCYVHIFLFWEESLWLLLSWEPNWYVSKELKEQI